MMFLCAPNEIQITFCGTQTDHTSWNEEAIPIDEIYFAEKIMVKKRTNSTLKAHGNLNEK